MRLVVLLAALSMPVFAAGSAPKADGRFVEPRLQDAGGLGAGLPRQVDDGQVGRDRRRDQQQRLKTDWFANFHDRRRAVEKRMKASDIAIVYLEFKPDGAYRGYRFSFAPGNGCGYCGGNLGVTSTVKLSQGKLVGTWK